MRAPPGIPTRGGKRAPFIKPSAETSALIEACRAGYEAAIAPQGLMAARHRLSTHRRDGSSRRDQFVPASPTGTPHTTEHTVPTAIEAPAREVVPVSTVPALQTETLSTGARLKALREARGWSISRLAKESGMKWDTIDRAETRASFADADPRARRSAQRVLDALLHDAEPGSTSTRAPNGEARVRTRKAAATATQPLAIVRETNEVPRELTSAHVEALASFLPPREAIALARTTDRKSVV